MRYNLIDFTRGIAFILMIVHHIHYFNPNDIIIPEYVEISGSFARSLFLFLVGVSISLSDKKSVFNLRHLYLLLSCIFITLITYIYLPDNNIIFFGVLHFIFLATTILKPISDNMTLIYIIGIVSFLINLYLKTLPGTNDIIGLIMGRYTISRMPIDIFPLFKWLPYVCIGIEAGRFYKDLELKSEEIFEPIELIGRNSLLLYVAHIIPCIVWMSQKHNK